MKELTDILRALAEIPDEAETALATVVRVTGSAYRSPGARLLIGPDGKMIGQVSGGCLERDVVRRAGGVIASGEPLLVRYETSNDPDNTSGLSMGCGGTIDVLIEPLNTADGRQLVEWLSRSRQQRCVLATVISKHHPLTPLGQRFMIDDAGVTRSSGPRADASNLARSDFEADHHGPEARVTSSVLTHQVLKIAQEALSSDRSFITQVEAPDAHPGLRQGVEIFFEILKPPTSLLIFGAGNDAIPLMSIGRLLGWNVTVVDLALAPPDPTRIWLPDRIVRCKPDQLAEQITIAPETAAVVMTHNSTHDQKLLRWLADQPLRYLGMLGPRHRTDQLLGDLRIDSLHAPVGLDIGAETPEEVALAIAAEITAVLRGHTGGLLAGRNGPIHVRHVAPVSER